MLIPQMLIIQKQSPVEVTKEFNAWSQQRSARVKELKSDEAEDTLGIPAATHLSWDQGLQAYIFTVIYLASSEELRLYPTT